MQAEESNIGAEGHRVTTREPTLNRLRVQRAAPRRKVSATEMLRSSVDDGDPEWLVQTNGADFGPYTLHRIKELLYQRKFVGDCMIFNQHDGTQFRIRTHPELREYVSVLEQQQFKEDSERQATHTESKGKRRSAIVVGLLALAMIIGGAIGAYSFFKKPVLVTKEKVVYQDKIKLASIDKIAIEWEKEPEDQAALRKKVLSSRRSTRRKGRRGRRGGGLANGDDVLNLGDASQGGGDALLSQGQIQTVMSKNVRRLSPCLISAASKNRSLKKVAISFGVAGSGHVTFSRANGEKDSSLARCIHSKMRAITFPAYDGNVTRAGFSMRIQ